MGAPEPRERPALGEARSGIWGLHARGASVPGPALDRRAFLSAAARGTALAAAAALSLRLRGSAFLADALAATTLADLARSSPRARFWATTAGGGECAACHGRAPAGRGHDPAHPVVKCLLCARGCVLPEGERGMCRARMNVGGEVRSLVYGRPIAIHVDPIEKKPFFHFLPGSLAYSLATSGCPLRCRFCQNWQISQAKPEDYDVPRRAAVDVAADAAGRGAPVLAFTYNEPTVFVEYLLDIAAAARERGIRSVLVSCGYMTEAPLAAMCEVLSAIKIDLKGFSEAFYRDVSQAELEPVKRSLRQVARSGVHLEIVNLVVPTLNDAEPALSELARWVAGELGPDVPIHFTRFHPDYQLPNLPPTPVETLRRARDLARAAGLRYAYTGNVPGDPGEDTVCPGCGAVVVDRTGFFVTALNLRKGACAACGTPIAGVWD